MPRYPIMGIYNLPLFLVEVLYCLPSQQFLPLPTRPSVCRMTILKWKLVTSPLSSWPSLLSRAWTCPPLSAFSPASFLNTKVRKERVEPARTHQQGAQCPSTWPLSFQGTKGDFRGDSLSGLVLNQCPHLQQGFPRVLQQTRSHGTVTDTSTVSRTETRAYHIHKIKRCLGLKPLVSNHLLLRGLALGACKHTDQSPMLRSTLHSA